MTTFDLEMPLADAGSIDFAIAPMRRHGPLLDPEPHRGTKDPCLVFDGHEWHIFGSTYPLATSYWSVLHATAPSIGGPWREQESVHVEIEGGCVAAPGVLYDDEHRLFHMYLQTECFGLDGTIEHLTSTDGYEFMRMGSVLQAVPGTGEAGIYDPHPAVIDGEKYIVYSGMDRIGHPDIYLAQSSTGSWYGPWERVSKILSHGEVFHHNQHDHHDYEWGLEGPQLIQLPDGSILMIAVCFLPLGVRGTRQRVFFAHAHTILGPYRSLGPVLPVDDIQWGEGENGHASAVIVGDTLELLYQARSASTRWRYGCATFNLAHIEAASGWAQRSSAAHAPIAGYPSACRGTAVQWQLLQNANALGGEATVGVSRAHHPDVGSNHNIRR